MLNFMVNTTRFDVTERESNEIQCAVEESFLAEIALALTNTVLPDEKHKSSEVVYKAIDSLSEKYKFDKNFKISPLIPNDLASQNFKIDFACRLKCETHQSSHYIFIELAFDNRQVLGTNILKLEVAQKILEKSSRPFTLGVLITVDKTSCRKLGWDGSIGTFEEYEIAYRNAYSTVLSARHTSFVLKV